ncbi:ABC transporter substrate-binding protein [Pseudooceanicola sp. HF7]|uniref:ABC transporter substrate-binding protein n=1 Tax=Pseudooceanicola sp. HF7 TaxID=2721560 RepID=UPI001430E23B|nr:ABC transporter substrate-binding protein [Pseudooceanicola sp. HF7]NIZ09126.1 ABC transporter substrate-binding protein [Pseudooceanicola sp. HF7]
MSAFAAVSRIIGAALFLGAAPGLLAAGNPPKRVVSINLCTDQLAMLLAAPGQLISVSDLAVEPRSSAMVEEARAYPINHAGAEEVWLMQPDLVLAGGYTSRATVSMLRRLGREVLEVQPAYSLADIRDRLARIGAALGREVRAEALIADFDARLEVLRAEVARSPSAAIYYANGYTTGDRTLAGEILMAAGFSNIAGDMRGGHLPLEKLAMADPEALITGTPYPGASRSEAVLAHPVVQAIRDRRASHPVADRDWLCGTPYVLQAVEELAIFRKEIE